MACYQSNVPPKSILLKLCLFLVLVTHLGAAPASWKNMSGLTNDVGAIKAAIRSVQPLLPNEKIEAYAGYIQVAAARYGIDPAVLIAITDQESDFRENLPEGKMGEIGLNQIRKSWLKNQLFRGEFKRATIKDLNNPAKSFLFAAWILHDLKKRDKPSAMPYWTRYNSPKMEFRQKYFALVNRKLQHIRDQDTSYLASVTPGTANLAH